MKSPEPSRLHARSWTAAIGTLVDYLQLEVLPVDLKAAPAARQLRAVTLELGLSLGARACLATALRTNCLVLSADTAWEQLKIRAITVQCIRWRRRYRETAQTRKVDKESLTTESRAPMRKSLGEVEPTLRAWRGRLSSLSQLVRLS